MFVRQLSVFLENRAGTLKEVADTLKEKNINILSLSLADTSEYGLLRMIVSDPDGAKTILRENGFSAMVTEVVAIRLENKVGMLQQLLKVIHDASLNVEYMYALASTQIGAMIIKTSDGEKAVEALHAAGMDVLAGDTLYSIQ